EDGSFDQVFFNRWVESRTRARANWNEVYDQVARSVNRNVYTSMMVASARVLDADLRARYEAQNTQIKVAYVAIEPTKELTDEELSTLYEANLDRYQTPAERTAAFVALPLDSADPESVDRQLARARAIAESAGASGDLAAAAAAEGLELQTSSSFSFTSTDIDNVPVAETALFRRSLIDLAEGAISEPIEGRTQIFVAKIVGVIEPVQKTLEEAREDVVRDAQDAYRSTENEEFEKRAHEYMDEIESNTEPLSAVGVRYPELKLEVKESPLFYSGDILFVQGILWGTEEAHARLSDQEPGTKIWMKDFRGTHYVLELTQSVKPDAQAWSENETAERAAFRETLLSAYENERRQDYLLHLSQKADAQSLIQRNWQAIFALLGLDDSPDTPLQSEAVNVTILELADPDAGASSEAAVSDPEAVTLESSGDAVE
ncbi:MAG: peptidyl-prolyl cis-trans isomerase, partial [Candidatus Hydrogenedentes bacterium]|nr:peptidyl-prolyl cis-trans isomerase [Candidatus Hydrogenedentota bacterium]